MYFVTNFTKNNTSCKRYYCACGCKALLRKGKSQINRFNYKALQFFDAFYLLSKEDVKKNKKLLRDYISNNLSKSDF